LINHFFHASGDTTEGEHVIAGLSVFLSICHSPVLFEMAELADWLVFVTSSSMVSQVFWWSKPAQLSISHRVNASMLARLVVTVSVFSYTLHQLPHGMQPSPTFNCLSQVMVATYIFAVEQDTHFTFVVTNQLTSPPKNTSGVVW